MPLYRYTAIDLTGRRVSGERHASDPDALLAALGNTVRQVESVQQIAAGPSTGAARSNMSRAEASEVSGHIAEIMEAQLPLESGLAAIAAECPSRRMRRTLRSIAWNLAQGETLEGVLARQGAPAELKALVRAGARSGNAAQVLEHYVLNVQSAVDLRQALRRSLVYPVTLLVAFGLVTTLIVGWIVPQFTQVFDGFSLTLPRMTEWLIAGSAWLRAYGALLLVAIAVGCGGIVLVLRLGLGRVGYRRLVCSLPWIGPIVRWTALARFSQMLSLLVENEVPLDEALVLAGDASGDAEIEVDCRRMRAGVTAGETLESAARNVERFPASFVQALSWEHRAHGLPEVLQSLGDMYAGRVRAAVAVLVALIPPAVMIVLGGFSSFVVIALFMPLIKLIDALT